LLVAHGWAKVLPVRSITVLVFMNGLAHVHSLSKAETEPFKAVEADRVAPP